MMSITLKRPVALVGMMGTGKTHIGRILADETGLTFVDSDHEIEEKSGMSIPEIFEHFGEDRFRSIEHRTILEILDKGPCILATGGGALMNPETLEALKSRTTMVWLDSPPEAIWERVKNCKNRPLLKTDDPRARLEELFREREPLYKQAHIRIANDSGQMRQTVLNIIKALSQSANSAIVRSNK